MDGRAVWKYSGGISSPPCAQGMPGPLSSSFTGSSSCTVVESCCHLEAGGDLNAMPTVDREDRSPDLGYRRVGPMNEARICKKDHQKDRLRSSRISVSSIALRMHMCEHARRWGFR